VGLGFRPELAADVLGRHGAVDFLEVVAEACFASAATRREACALAEVWCVVPHGVKLSLGSADGVDEARARALGALARSLRAPCVTEHVAFTRAGGREIGHLTPLPRTRAAVRTLARNVDRARRFLPDVPLYLENVAWTFQWPGDEMDEGTFYAEVCAQTRCQLLLDVGNVYANARNAGVAPEALLARYPLEHVAMVHLAGGALEDGFYADTHAHPVGPEVFALLARALARTGSRPVLLERDRAFPPFAELAEELERARALLAAASLRPVSTLSAAPAAERARAGSGSRAREDGAVDARLGDAQRALAATLGAVAGEEPTAGGHGVDPCAIARTRAVLARKRLEDALPLLPQARRFGAELARAADEWLRDAPRAPRGAAATDALCIAARASADPRFAPHAALDHLVLRARFAPPRGERGASPRWGPFVGRVRVGAAGTVWALKGVGATAAVRVFGDGKTVR
jgi:uncharacterized protein (UPF0276 family)